ncbi:ribosome biogenesis GTPase [Paenibacillus jamilae]|uniref:ribosome small subunit-dependent GTPase A n=1 Tax=Paenibacillus TaxID=44249 RepID=UPI000D2FF8C9|nr:MULTISPECIES: ribosome small subunit-dependent GTPase A [Paenibacillus]KAF6620123.1 ribosome small subunit-dependent GTPase A [Paenibacillus sp. EKM101P]KAF6623115.1 ribosome small subunit-dependent GTPase A [Paenibacillus sp. EKM102P]KAF6634329.1 ribosome small subunit-dependent GTPase A [Paenibacillus sp. EKM10P]KAF6649849.1 ribosome small subunit-dependent GTPase A [Paenibacillus sp. EKM11P]MBY0023897.1 ribosome small subunit-dependent GTPase A [Paenibacillus polymyxa]
MPEGLIVKALSGYYYVSSLDQDGRPVSGEATVQCRARGLFKKKEITPLVGDRVVYELTENGEGMVKEIRKRTTELIRPPVANTTLAVLLFSLREPDLNLPLLDKFLVHIEHAGLDTIICLTKRDLYEGSPSEDDKVLMVQEMYRKIGYEVLVTSARTGEGTAELKKLLAGQISVFSGQSGVGKSSMLNALEPGLTLETSAISNKLGRGRHTTRHVELIPLDNGGFVADTPGFSQLDFLELGVDELSPCFREFQQYAEGCKFRGCTHIHEPGCKVREALEEGHISQGRYDSYMQFYQELKEKKRRY